MKNLKSLMLSLSTIVFTSILFIFSCNLDIGLGQAVDTETPQIFFGEVVPDNAIIRGTFNLSGTWRDDGIISVSIKLLEISDDREIVVKTWALKDSESPVTSSFDGKNSGTWSFKIDTTDFTDSSKYKIEVTITDTYGHSSSKTKSITIDNTSPVLVIQRPTTAFGETGYDSYGQEFIVKGYLGDSCDKKDVKIEVYQNTGDVPVYTMTKENINSTDFSITVAEKNSEDEELRKAYDLIYGNSEGTRNLYFKISAYDKAYDYSGLEVDATGNITEHFYLYNALYSDVFEKYGVTDIYEMNRSISPKDKNVLNVLSQNEITYGQFSINPANNPSFKISGKNPFKKDGTDFEENNETYYITNGSTIVAEIDPGLDQTPLMENSLGLYVIEWDSETNQIKKDAQKIPIYKPLIIKDENEQDVENPDITEEEKQARAGGISSSGNTYKFKATLKHKIGYIEVGKKYAFGIYGYDQKGIPVENQEDTYGFLFSTNVAPTPKVTEPAVISYLKKDKDLTIKGIATTEVGVPDILVTVTAQGTSENFEGKITASQETKTKIESSYECTIPAEVFTRMNLLGAEDFEISVKAIYCDLAGSVQINVLYDTEAPEIEITSPAEGEWLSEIGSVTVSGKISDNLSSVDKIFYSTTTQNVSEKDQWREYKPSGITFKDEGLVRTEKEGVEAAFIAFYAIDKAENVSEVLTRKINVDTEKPVLSALNYNVGKGDTAVESGVSVISATKNYSIGGSFKDTGTQVVISATRDGEVLSVEQNGTTSGQWTITENNVNEGSHIYEIQAVDQSGKTAVNRITIIADVTNPEITELPVMPGREDTKVSSYTFTGKANDATSGVSKVELTVTDKKSTYTEEADGTSNWSKKLTYAKFGNVFNEEGEKFVTITVTDNAGNTFTTKPQSFLYDKADPVLTTDETTIQEFMPETGFIISGKATDSYGIESLKILETKGQPGDENYYSQEKELKDLIKNGNWSIKVPLNGTVEEGAYNYSFVLADKAGHEVTTKVYTSVVDTTPPKVSIINPGEGKRQGTNAINEISYKLEGSFERDTSGIEAVWYTIAKSVPAKPSAELSLSTVEWNDLGWTKATSGTLGWNSYESFKAKDSDGAGHEEGSYTLYVYAVDKAGNISSLESSNFDVDLSEPELEAGNTSEYITKEAITFSGTATDTNGIKSLVITDNLNPKSKWEVSLGPNGTWSKTLELADENNKLADGNHTITITAEDTMGKKARVTKKVTVDTKAPVINEAVTLPSVTDTEKQSFTFRGNVSEVAPSSGMNIVSLVFSDGEKVSEPIIASGTSNWTCDVNFADSYMNRVFEKEGLKSVTIQAIDNAGNTTQKTTQFQFDLNAPELFDIELSDNTNYFNTNKLTVRGKIKDSYALLENGCVEITDVTGGRGTVLAQINASQVNADGSWSTEIEVPENVLKTIKITAKDKVGKTSDQSYKIYRDTEAPVITSISVTDNVLVSSLPYTITLRANDAGSGVEKLLFSLDGTTPSIEAQYDAANGSWIALVNEEDISEGITNFKLVAADALGNRCDVHSRSFMYDKAEPVLEENSGTGDIVNRSITLKGLATDSNSLASVIITDNINKTSKWIVNVDSEGSWLQSIALTEEAIIPQENKLTDGKHTLTIIATDIAGKTTKLTKEIVVDQTNPEIEQPRFTTNPLYLDVSTYNTLTVAVTDVTTSVSSVYYNITKENQTPDVSDAGWQELNRGNGSNWTATINLSDNSDGVYYVYVKALDEIGNIALTENGEGTTLTIDKKKPVISVTGSNNAKSEEIELTVGITDSNPTEPHVAITVPQNGAAVTAILKNAKYYKADGTQITGINASESTEIDYAEWTVGIPLEKIASDNGSDTLADGNYTIVISAEDKNHRQADNVSHTILRDTTPPQIEIITQGGYVTGQSLKFEGIITEVYLKKASAVLYKNGVATNLNTNLQPDLAGNWSWTLYEGIEEDAEYTIKVTAEDNAGLVTVEESPVITIDRTSPTTTLLLDNEDSSALYDSEGQKVNGIEFGGTYYTNCDGIKIKGTITETNFNRQKVVLKTTKNKIAYTAPELGGMGKVWSFVPETSSDGTYEYELTITDEAGHVLKESITVIVDKTAPKVLIAYPTDGSIINMSTVSANGTVVENGIGIRNNEIYYSTNADSASPEWIPLSYSGGNLWSQNLQLESEGNLTFTLKAADKLGNALVGNAEEPLESISFNYDKATPTLILDSLTSQYINGGENKEVIVSGKAYDSNSIVKVVITGNGSELTYNFSDKEKEKGKVLGTAPSWQIALKVGAENEGAENYLPEGSHNLTVTLYDAAGRTTEKSVSFIVDTVAPTIVTPLPYPSVSETEAESYNFIGQANDATTQVTEVQIAFGDSSDAKLNPDAEDSKVLVKKATGTSTWTYLCNFESERNIEDSKLFATSGNKTLYVRAKDNAGNWSSWQAQDFIFDKGKPVVTVGTYTETSTDSPVNAENPVFYAYNSASSKDASGLSITASKVFKLQGLITDDWALATSGGVKVYQTKDDGVQKDISSYVDITAEDSETGIKKGWTVSGLPRNPEDVSKVLADTNLTGSYKYKIVVTDKAGKTSEKTLECVIDVTPPIISLSLPTKSLKASEYISGTSYTIYGNATDVGKAGLASWSYQFVKVPSNGITNENKDSDPVTDLYDNEKWTEVAATNGNWSLSKDLGNTTEKLSDGKWIFYYKAKDNSGNESLVNFVILWIDNSKPNVTASVTTGDSCKDGGTATKPVYYFNKALTGSASATVLSDLPQIVTISVSTTNSAGTTTNASIDANGIWTLPLTAFDEGSVQTVSVIAKNICGKTDEKTFSVCKDTTAPEITITRPELNDKVESKNEYMAKGSISENGIGFVTSSVQYRINGGNWTSISSDSANGSVSSTSWSQKLNLTEIAQGVVTLEVQLTDKLGNVATTSSVNFYYDYEIPHVGFGTDSVVYPTAEGSSSANKKPLGTYVKKGESFILKGTAYDSYKLNYITITDSADSTQTYSTLATKDSSGAARLVIDVNTPIDKATTTEKAAKWTLSLASTELGEGTHNFKLRAYDVSGNESEIETKSIFIDKIAPQIDETENEQSNIHKAIKMPSLSDTRGTSVKFVGYAKDGSDTASDSGVAKVLLQFTDNTTQKHTEWLEASGSQNWTYTLVYNDESELTDSTTGNSKIKDVFGFNEGDKTLKIKVVDAAGNESTPITKSFTYDKALPEVSVEKYKLAEENAISLSTSEIKINKYFALSGKASDSYDVQRVELRQNGKLIAVILKEDLSDGEWTVSNLPRKDDYSLTYDALTNASQGLTGNDVTYAKDENGNVASGDYEYSVTVYDKATNRTIKEKALTVKIDTKAPTIKITYPNPNKVTDGKTDYRGDSSIAGSTVNFAGTASDEGFGVVGIKYVISSSSTYDGITENWTLDNSTAWGFKKILESGTGAPTSSDYLKEGHYYLYTKAIDAAGNETEKLQVPSVEFYVDLADPVVSDTRIDDVLISENKIHYFKENAVAFTGKITESNGISAIKVGDSTLALKTIGKSEDAQAFDEFGNLKVDGYVKTSANTYAWRKTITIGDEDKDKALDIKLEVVDAAERTVTKIYNLYRDTKAPEIKLINPEDNIKGKDSLSANSFNFRASVSDGAGSGVNVYKYLFTTKEITADEGMTVKEKIIASATANDAAAKGWGSDTKESWTKLMELISGSNKVNGKLNESLWYLYIYAVDEVGLASTETVWFWVDKELPTVTTTYMDSLGPTPVKHELNDSKIVTVAEDNFEFRFMPADNNGMNESEPYNIIISRDGTELKAKNTTDSESAYDYEVLKVMETLGETQQFTGEYKVVFNAPVDGLYNFKLTVRDAAEKDSNQIERNIRKDTVGPVVSISTPEIFSTWQTTSTLKVKGSANDDSEVTGVYYAFNSESIPALPAKDGAWTGWTKCSSTSNWEIELRNVPDGRTNTLYIAAVDKNGIASATRVVEVITKDGTVPQLTETGVTVSGKKYTASESSVILSGTLTDATSGIKSLLITDSLNANNKWEWDFTDDAYNSNIEEGSKRWTKATGEWSQIITLGSNDNELQDGEHVLTLYATDVAGNSYTMQRSVTIDTAQPSFGTLSVSKNNSSDIIYSNNGKNWYSSSAVRITLPTVADKVKDGYVSGVSGVEYAITNASVNTKTWIPCDKASTKNNDDSYDYTATVNCSDQGLNTIFVRVTDAVGNIKEYDTPANVYVDTISPATVTLISVDGDTSTSALTGTKTVNKRNDVEFVVTATDANGNNGSGIAGVNVTKIGQTDVTSAVSQKSSTEEKWTITVPKNALASGSPVFTATDNVGKTYSYTADLRLDIDATKPESKKLSLPDDADTTTSVIDVNKGFKISGSASDDHNIKSVDICYYIDADDPAGTEENAKKGKKWTYLCSIDSSSLTNWESVEIDSTDLFAGFDTKNVYFVPVIMDEAGNCNLDTLKSSTVDGKTVTNVVENHKRISVGEGASTKTILLPKDEITPDNILATNGTNLVNIAVVKVNQDSDRPLIKFTNLTSTETGYILKFGTNASLEGSVKDDDNTTESVVAELIASNVQLTEIPQEDETDSTENKWTKTTTDDGTSVTWSHKIYGTTVFNKSTGEYTYTPADVNDGQKEVYFIVQDNNEAIFYTGNASDLEKPYQLYKTDGKANNVSSSIVYNSDGNNPSVSDIKVQAYDYSQKKVQVTQKDDSGTDVLVDEEPQLTGTSLVLGGKNKQFAQFIVVAHDANGIDYITLALDYEKANDSDDDFVMMVTKDVTEGGVSYTESGRVEYSVDGTTYVTPAEENTIYPYMRWTTDLIDISKIKTGTVNCSILVWDNSGLKGNSSPIFVADNDGPETVLISPSSSDETSGEVTMTGTTNDVGSARAISIEWLVPEYKDTAKTDEEIKELTGWKNTREDSTTVANWKFKSNFLDKSKDDSEVMNGETGTGHGTYWKSKTDDGIYTIPVYFRATDSLGNVSITRKEIIYNPDADKPKTDISYPSAGDYDKKSDGSRENFVTLGGTIRVNGSVTIPSGLTTPYKVYIQIADDEGNFGYDSDSDDVEDTHGIEISGTAAYKAKNTYLQTIKTQAQVAAELDKDNLSGFESEELKNSWWGIEATLKSNSWSINLNGDNKMNVENGTNQIKIRACGVNAFGKVGNWSEPVYVHIDNKAPTYSGTLYQFENIETPSAEVYKNAIPNAKSERAYEAGMYLKGQWVLCVKLLDEDKVNISEVKKSVGSNSATQTYYQTKLVENMEEGKNGRYVFIPLDADATTTTTYTVTAYDMDSISAPGVHIIYPSFEINMDNTPPELTSLKTTNGAVVEGQKISNSNYETTFATNASDTGSGFKMMAYYFKRTIGSSTTIELPLPQVVDADNKKWTAGSSYVGNTSELSEKSNLWGVELSGKLEYSSENANTTFTVSKVGDTVVSDLTAYPFIRVGSLIELEGSFYTISEVSGKVITVETRLSGKDNASAFAAAAFVVNINENTEVSTWDGGTVTITNDDGDGLFEYANKKGTSYELEFGVCADELDDGPIELCRVAFDAAGNYTGQPSVTARSGGSAETTTMFLANHTPRLSKVYLATDLNGNGTYSNDEFGGTGSVTSDSGIKYFSALAENGSVQDAPVIYGARIGAGTKYSPVLTMRNKLGVALEFVSGYNSTTHAKEKEGYGAGNGDVYYLMSVSKNVIDKAATGTIITQGDESSGVEKSLTIEKLDVFADTSVKDNKGFEISSDTEGLSDYEITKETEDNAASLAFINISLWDSTPGTTPGAYDSTIDGVKTWGSQWTALNIPVFVDVVDDIAPTVEINEPQAKKNEGHIDKVTEGVKASGEIVFTGSVSDEKRIGALYLTMNKNFTETTESGTKYEANTKTCVGIYNESTGILSKTGEDTDSNKTYDMTISDGVVYRVISQTFDLENGHTIEWELEVDTSTVEGVAEKDVTFAITAHNSSGDVESDDENYDDLILDSSDNIDKYKRGFQSMQIDIVPYITGLKTSLDNLYEGNASVYSRTARGHYITYDREQLTVSGYNLANGTVSISGKNAEGTDVTETANLDDDNKFTLPENAISGEVTITVNGVSSLNNKNDDNLSTTYYGEKEETKANLQPNGVNNDNLTDDVILDIWEFKTAANPRDGEILYPEMQIGPNGEVGFAFVNGNFYFNMAGPSKVGDTAETGDTFASQRAYEGDYAPYFESAFAFDAKGRTYGISTNQDANDQYSAYTTFYYGRRTSNSPFGKEGWNSHNGGNYQGGAYRRRLQSTTSTVVGTVQDTSVFRAMSPTITTVTNDNDTSVYLAFYDAVRKEIRYRWGNIGDIVEKGANIVKTNKEYHAISYVDRSDNKWRYGHINSKTYLSRTAVTDGYGGNETVYLYNGDGTLYKDNNSNYTFYTGINTNNPTADDHWFRLHTSTNNIDKENEAVTPFPSYDANNTATHTKVMYMSKQYYEDGISDSIYSTKINSANHGLKKGDAITLSFVNNSYMNEELTRVYYVSRVVDENNFEVSETVDGDSHVFKTDLQLKAFSKITGQLIDASGGNSSTNSIYARADNRASDMSVRPELYSVIDTPSLTKTTAAVAIGVTPASVDNGVSNDVVSIAWYDGKKLCYAYSTNPQSDDGATPGSNFTHVTTLPAKFTGAGFNVKMKVDTDGGIHLAFFTTSGAKLRYAYAPDYMGNFTVVDVDNYSLTTNDIGLDVAKDADGNLVPYISYLSGNQVAKLAYPVAWNEKIATKPGIKDSKYTGDWEITVVPTTGYTTKNAYAKAKNTNAASAIVDESNKAIVSDLTPKYDTICVGVNKNWEDGTLCAIKQYTTASSISGDDTDSNYSTRIGGNGSKNPALAYTVVGDSSLVSDSLQFAQKK
ncbi:MAG: Ig-like domain-containing protein [Treponema sp.]|nr:Ig-like domain-containing protein [Treponema sp.]